MTWFPSIWTRSALCPTDHWYWCIGEVPPMSAKLSQSSFAILGTMLHFALRTRDTLRTSTILSEGNDMKAIGLLLVSAMTLAACGGGNRVDRSSPVQVRFATGPIYQACLKSDRKARSRSLCGCIQDAANRTLLPNYQSQAVKFYNNPQLAQDIRQSDRAKDERFWNTYKEYSRVAKASCG